MRALFAFLVSCSLLELGPTVPIAQAADLPVNVIVILADDLGYGDLGCYGHPNFKTPRLDAMAAEGMRLTQFNTPMPFCAPTRAALLTGRYPFRCGMVANPAPDGNPAADRLALAADERTLAEYFRAAGYATGMVGKWHLGHKERSMYPTQRGFDDYFGILYSNDMRPVQLIDGESVVENPAVQASLTKRYTERAIDFISKHSAKPFFLYLAHAMPHKPLAASEDYYQKSGAGLYGDVIAELDASVGRVLDHLKSTGLDQRTLVIFTSDNGPWYGGSTGGLRGMKAISFEGGFRVPLIARWPGVIKSGQVSAATTVMMDVFATALSAAEIASPADRKIDGINLLPLLKTGEMPELQERHILGHSGEPLATIRNARWKLHVRKPSSRQPIAPDEPWVDPRGPDGSTILAPKEQAQPSEFPGLHTGDAPKPMMLFDLAKDPGEQHDVASEYPEVVQDLLAEFEQSRWPAEAKIVSVAKIWDAGKHNAFTDLIRWHDRWLCTFREAEAHVGGEGNIRVIASSDGKQWESLALIAEQGIDLRDPKFSVTPDDRLMIVAGGSVYEGKTLLGRQPRVMFSSDGRNWTHPQRVLTEGDWLWRVTWHAGTAYGISYDPSKRATAAAKAAAATGKVQPGPEDWKLKLFASKNGVDYDLITYLDVPGNPNETTLRFLPDGEMIALVRREAGNTKGWIGRSQAPYQDWSWQETNHRLGGPNFLRLSNGCLIAGSRQYPSGANPGGAKMSLAAMAPAGAYEPFLTLPSGGDCSYPGMVEHQQELWLSYYSTHEGKSAIYLARVAVSY